MKNIAIIVLSLFILPASADNQVTQRTTESKAVIQTFMQQLKTELQSSMKAGGPANAVDVCQYRAPVIAKTLSDKTGWKVARISLKPRNPANAADAWETKVLQAFEQRKGNGESPKTMAYSEEVSLNGVKSFRFMKAIPTGKVCLQCHGEHIKPELAAKLDASYPNDKARGYKFGDIRGAFSITQPVND